MTLSAEMPKEVEALRQEIVGIDQLVPLLDGSSRPYIYLDNAASTPPFRYVQTKVNELMGWYSSVHRGTGLKSLVSSRAYEQAHEIVGDFVGADPEHDVVIFGKNTTEAINTLANTLDWRPGDVVITTLLEHHSDDLPWRAHAEVEHAWIDEQGSLDMADLEACLKAHAGHVRIVAVTGASNVTGFAPPVHEIARLAHAAGAWVLADCAQLAPHRQVRMGLPGDPGHLDFVVLSGHKIYAPFGTGALIGPREFFRQLPPEQRGGGTIEVVTLDEVHWADPPERNEAGSPNVIGAVALAASLRVLEQVGMEAVARHEKELTAYTLERLNRLDGVRIYGSDDPGRLDDRLGVISFALEGIHHAKVAAILGFEGGIGVRNGCFCAHPYILTLLDVHGEPYDTFKRQVLAGDRTQVPGLVRVSFGCYNTRAEVDSLVEMLEHILDGRTAGDYVQDQASGSFYPRGYDPAKLENYFKI